MKTDGDFKDYNESYLVFPSEITSVTRLDDFNDKTSDYTQGMFGSWYCTGVYSIMDYANASCLRFLPTSESESNEDPVIDFGEVRVMTYMTNRDVSIQESNFNENETLVLESTFLEAFDVNFLGAINGISTAAVAIVTSAALLQL